MHRFNCLFYIKFLKVYQIAKSNLLMHQVGYIVVKLFAPSPLRSSCSLFISDSLSLALSSRAFSFSLARSLSLVLSLTLSRFLSLFCAFYNALAHSVDQTLFFSHSRSLSCLPSICLSLTLSLPRHFLPSQSLI